MLVWRKGNINKNCLCVTVLCTIIMVHKDTRLRAVLTGRLTVSGFDLDWFSSLFSKRLCVIGLEWCYIDTNFFLLTSFSLPFSKLSLVGLALDVVD